jgi:hypothetical protein
MNRIFFQSGDRVERLPVFSVRQTPSNKHNRKRRGVPAKSGMIRTQPLTSSTFPFLNRLRLTLFVAHCLAVAIASSAALQPQREAVSSEYTIKSNTENEMRAIAYLWREQQPTQKCHKKNA